MQRSNILDNGALVIFVWAGGTQAAVDEYMGAFDGLTIAAPLEWGGDVARAAAAGRFIEGGDSFLKPLPNK